MTYAERFASAPVQRRRKHGPQRDDEWNRIWALPRRSWSSDEMAHSADELSRVLRKPGSTATLFPVQGAALCEIAEHRGLVGAFRVGAGKTLISLLAPRMLGATRPLLILPAKLETKTHKEAKAYRRDWQIGTVPTISIEKLRRVNQADYLYQHRPDMIVIDEVHRLANRKASAAARISRYLDDHPCPVVVLTGTLTDDALDDYAHMVRWALERPPVPLTVATTSLWSDALCEPPKSNLGAFSRFGDVPQARAAYRERLLSTPGFMVSDAQHPGEIHIRRYGAKPSEKCLDAIKAVESTWTLPDGQELADALQLSRALFTLALGYWMRWRVPGPIDWMTARKEWAVFVREQVSRTNTIDAIDTEEQCKDAVLRGILPEGAEVLAHWEAIKPTFTPESIVEWVDDSGIDVVKEWCDAGPGVVWYSHRAIGEACAQRGVRHYGQQGLDGGGNPIESARADEACIASIRSSGEGRNLQQFSRMLVLEPPGKPGRWEQLIGRMHRPGQERPVMVDVYAPTERHADMVRRAMAKAEYIEATMGQPQKLLQANNEF